jgi:hypothetical protein
VPSFSLLSILPSQLQNCQIMELSRHGVRYPKVPICPKMSVTSFLFRALKTIILFAHVLVSSPSLQPKYISNPCYELLGVCAPSQTYGQYGTSLRGLCALSFADINISSSIHFLQSISISVYLGNLEETKSQRDLV